MTPGASVDGFQLHRAQASALCADLPKAPAASYRPEVDGLRAGAVLAVILFHIDPHWLPGGFAGVDVFFVISGYLITGIVAREFDAGEFSMREFYLRRVRRILPALWALLLVCLPVSWWLMLPADAEAMGKSMLWSILALANVFFWREVVTDYFAPQSAQMPFLHLWSLGVEEQFYLFWPLALWLLWRVWKAKARVAGAWLALLVLVGATLLAELLLARQEVRFAYYMLPARAGELAVGAFFALAWPRPRARLHAPDLVAQGAAVLGWALILFSFVWLDEGSPFPGLRSLLPTLAAAALIVSGGRGGADMWLYPLRHPAVLWLGRCSYSAYLWHWPVLAWWRYLWGQPGLAAGAGLLLLIVLLAGLSQRWVEGPARRLVLGLRNTVVLYVLLPAVLLAALALLLTRGEKWGLQVYSDAQQHGWQALQANVRPAHHLAWVCQRQVLDAETLSDAKCEFGAGSGPAKVLLLGDSHAAQFAPMIRHAAEAQNVRVRSVALGSRAVLPGSLAGVVSDSRLRACEHGMPQLLARAADFPLLIIGSDWASYAARDAWVWDRLEAFLAHLTARGHAVWLLPRVPSVDGYDASCQAKRLRVGDWLQCPTTLPQSGAAAVVNRQLSQLAARIPGVRFLALQSALCQEPQCPVVDSEGRATYADAFHLSVHGALQLASELETSGALPDLRTP